MNLFEEMKLYIDKESGLITAPDGGRDNLILFSAYTYRECFLRFDVAGMSYISEKFKSWMVECCIEPGLYARYPGGDNSIDNLIGACYLSTEIAKHIIDRWNECCAIFDCSYPETGFIGMILRRRWRYWFGRFVGVKSFIKACAGQKLNFIDRILWTSSTVFSAWFSKGASDPLLQSLQCDVMRGNAECLWAVKLWLRHYDVWKLYSEYFGPEHPLTKSRE